MSPGASPLYKHSGRFSGTGLLLALAAPATVAFPLGYIYAYLIKYIPFIYLNFIITGGYGFASGAFTGWLLQRGKVRNNALAALAGVSAGFFALYFAWSAHIHSMFDHAPIVFYPEEILRGVNLLYQQGSWSLHGSEVKGIPLAIVWAVEAAGIIGLSTITAYAMVSQTPFCERADCWLSKERTISGLDAFSDPTQIAAFQAGDVSSLSKAKLRTTGSATFGRLKLKYSDGCDEFCTLTVSNVTSATDSKGNVKERVKIIAGNILLPKSMLNTLGELDKPKPEISAPVRA